MSGERVLAGFAFLRKVEVVRNPMLVGAKSVKVLEMIAKGHTYEQILSLHSDLTYPDIFRAAQEALDALEPVSTSYQQRLERIRRSYPRAYEKWTEEEDTTLRQLVRDGHDVDELARRLQRQPGAISSRIQKMGLLADDAR